MSVNESNIPDFRSNNTGLILHMLEIFSAEEILSGPFFLNIRKNFTSSIMKK